MRPRPCACGAKVQERGTRRRSVQPAMYALLGEHIVEADDDGAETPPLVGWQVIEQCTKVMPRALPGLRTLIAARGARRRCRC